jgi:hypothetical protein
MRTDAAPVRFPTLWKSRCLCAPVDSYGIRSIESLSPGGAVLGPIQLF